MPVLELILDRLPATLFLTLTAFGMSLLLGIVFGLAAAARQGRWSDTMITTMALLFYATPLFWVALNLIGEGLNDALNPRLARKGR